MRTTWRYAMAFVIAAAINGVCSSAWALTDDEIYSQFQFNFITPGARATAMGGAFIGLAADSTAVESNPAGLTQLTSPEISAEYKYLEYTVDQYYGNARNPDGTLNFEEIDRREFTDTVNSIPFLSVVYPYSGEKRKFVFSLYRQELVNYASSFQSGKLIGLETTTTNSTIYYPVKASVDTTVTNYGVGVATDFFDGQFSVAVSPRWSQLQMNSSRKQYGKLAYAALSLGIPYVETTFSENDIMVKTDIDDEDSGFSVNIGIKWDPDPRVSLGAVYRSGPEFMVHQNNLIWSWEKERMIEWENLAEPTEDRQIRRDASDFTLKVPDTAGAGVAFRAADTDRHGLRMTADVVYLWYEDLLEDFDPLWTGMEENDKFTVENGAEIHLGVEYEPKFLEGDLFSGLFVRAGLYSDPDHAIRYTGTSVYAKELFPGGEDQLHYTGGIGVVLKSRLQMDTAVNISESMKQFSLSMVLYF